MWGLVSALMRPNSKTNPEKEQEKWGSGSHSKSTGWPLTFCHCCGSVLAKQATVWLRMVLTRLRQNGRPCAMMLMLKILRTFWGGNCSLATSLGSGRSSAWSPGGTCKVSFPETAVGIFLRAPDDEKRGIGQCRSIAKRALLLYHTQEHKVECQEACGCERLSFLRSLRAKCPHLSTPESPPCWVSPFIIS